MNNCFHSSIRNRIRRVIARQCAYSLGSALVALIFCAGCATNNAAQFRFAPDDQNKAAKDFSVPADKSVIYVIDDQFGEKDILQLQVDQKNVCRLTGRTFYRMELEPGSHQLALRYSGEWSNSGGPIRIGKEIIASLEPGRAYFFHGSLATGASVGLLSGATTTTVKIEFEQEKWLDTGRGRRIIQRPMWHLTGEIEVP